MKKKTRAEEIVDNMSDETLKAIGFGVIKAVTITFLIGVFVGWFFTK
jgi:hypothetical protein